MKIDLKKSMNKDDKKIIGNIIFSSSFSLKFYRYNL